MVVRRRKASVTEREYAAELVHLYRRAKQAPSGILCVNPEDPTEEHALLDYRDPELLLSALDRFSKNGVFDDPLSDSVNVMLIRQRFDELRSQGKTYEVSREELANELQTSETSIRRALTKSKSNL